MRVVVGVLAAVALLALPPPAAAEDDWVWPAEGAVLTPYSNDNSQPYAGGMHRGIDIGAGVGARVVAARAGTVTHAGAVGSAGLTVSVRTADGRHLTSYLHLSAIDVREGEPVAAGARIGAVGTTGRRSVEEPHLHFGVRLTQPAGHYVDPLSLLPPGATQVAPPPPVPTTAPARAAPAPVPVAVPVKAPRGRHARAPVPRRMRPEGAFRPGPAVAVPAAPAVAPLRGRGHEPDARPRLPALGPAPGRVPVRRTRAAPPRAAAPTAPRGDRGRGLVLGGLAAIGLVLFGGAAWRVIGRANASVNVGVVRAAQSILAAAFWALRHPVRSPHGDRQP